MAEAQDRKQQKGKADRGKADRRAQAKDAKNAASDRRATHRVSDDQDSGQGSMSALSKLQMQERKRALMRALRDDIV